jgi:hypothetical protein
VAGVAPVTVLGFAGSADGDALKVVMSGSAITCYRNGIQLGTIRQAFNANATQHGIANHNGNVSRLVNFSFM